MKTNRIFAASLFLSVLLFATTTSRAEWITAISSGTWGDTNIWDTGTVPGTNDFVEVDSPFNVTVETNAITQYVFGSGTVTMAANSSLEVNDPTGANATYQLGVLDTSAAGNTVIYSGNPFWAKHQNYCNLVFSNTVATNQNDFYNGTVSSQSPAAAMIISGNMTIVGKTKVQLGADFRINGNLLMDTNATWDSSSFNFTVLSNLTLGTSALLLDLDGASGSNYFGGNVLVSAAAIGWNLTDVIQWGIGGSLTNNGTLVGKGYGSISFDGTGLITGSKAIKIPTLTVNGTYTIGTTITLTTNTPTLNGTLVFDLANTNRINLQSYPTNPLTLYYSGNLNVINSGAAPVAGKIYKFFNATNYDGAFGSINLPGLPGGLSWVNNLLTSGSMAVTTAVVSAPTLTLVKSGGVLTLSWDSATYPGYSVQAQTNSAGVGTSWSSTSSGTGGTFVVPINPANPPVFFRLSNP